ncbi:hypothetical protein M9991_00375 [Chryseobacterium gallinarum]|uniref:hypothetical protein n=1 Tax=Chryseobacterium gallinarum TaxID=1324352 RepID=UPI0020253EAC|nr:hypothetical protein [Chryseobacterium gallinarum]MCL8535315.1 hypothetical protein [Chryseobacterium gallinarum]
MKKIILFFCTLSVGLLYSQKNTSDDFTCSPYYGNFNSAKLKYHQGSTDFVLLDSLIQKALSTNSKPLSVDLFFSLKVYAKNCREDHFVAVSEMLLKNGLNINTILNEVPSCISKNGIKEKLKNIIPYNKDNAIAKLLNEIHDDDKKSQSVLTSNKKREEINNKNYTKLIGIINQVKKWPGISVSGQDLNIYHVDISYDFTQALLHFNQNQIETLMPYLKEAIKNQELSPYHFARIYDYYYIKKTTDESLKEALKKNPKDLLGNSKQQLPGIISKQFYGIYKSNDRKEIYPAVIDPDKLKERREKICMIGDDLELD